MERSVKQSLQCASVSPKPITLCELVVSEMLLVVFVEEDESRDE